MKVSFEEIGRISASFACTEGQAGQVCKIGADSKVVPCLDGDKFCGMVESLRKGAAAVQLHGFCRLPYTGAAPALGYTALQANGQGGVKAAGTKEYLVVSVDTVRKTAVIEL